MKDVRSQEGGRVNFSRFYAGLCRRLLWTAPDGKLIFISIL